MKLEHKDIWKFTYKDIYCEIAHWGVGYMDGGKGIWNENIIAQDLVNTVDKYLLEQLKK